MSIFDRIAQYRLKWLERINQMGENRISKQPVSYTHLDVYKRQACNGQLLFHTLYCLLMLDCSCLLYTSRCV